jgi:subtilisin family serine protease
VLALIGAVTLIAALAPAAAAEPLVGQRYIVVLKGGYALDGSYALGKGYALVAQDETSALGGTYALGRQYALYALNRTYALANQYALTDEYALTDTYALFGEYALGSGYALDEDYALGSGYALGAATLGYALDSAYALLDQTAAYALGSQYALLDAYALDKNYALARDYALHVITEAGGTLTADLTRQIGVMVVDSLSPTFAQTLKQYALVERVGRDFGSDVFKDLNETVEPWTGDAPELGPERDPLEGAQWNMDLIRTHLAHTYATGRKVDVGVIDSGIDGQHPDFMGNPLDISTSSVDCARGADFTFEGPGIGNPLACVDNQFHGTHVAGIIGARKNGIGIVGVAPNATLVPIKACDADGHCYVSDAVEGITYAGDLGLDVVNMSFFVDDDDFQQSTEFKCQDNDTQRAYRVAVERALAYARGEGVTLVAALGNSDTNLANPPGGAKCKTVPAQAKGVIGTVALGPDSEKSWYSSWGSGWADVSAPGGNEQLGEGNCLTEVLSTLPGNAYGCIQGTSMAAPHTAGVAALIVGRFGSNDGSGGLRWAPDKVNKKLIKTSIDVGKKRYDKCFGNGRIDALRAARNQTSYLYDASAPACTEP